MTILHQSFIKNIENSDEYTKEQKESLIKHFKLKDDTTKFDILINIMETFRIESLVYNLNSKLPEGIDVNLAAKFMVINLHEAYGTLHELKLHDKYLIKFAIHRFYHTTGPLLQHKLMSLYRDIKEAQRSLEDITMDLILLNKYNHNILHELTRVINDELTFLKEERGENNMLDERVVSSIALRLPVVNKTPYEGEILLDVGPNAVGNALDYFSAKRATAGGKIKDDK